MNHVQNIVFLVESRNSANRIKPLLSKYQDKFNLQFIHTLAIGLYQFKYPSHIKIKDLPAVFEPEWQLRKNDGSLGFKLAPHTLKDDQIVATALTVSEVLTQADVIVLTEYHDMSAIHSVYKILEFNPHQANVVLLRDSKSTQKEIDSIFNATAQKLQDEPLLHTLYEQSKVKKYFDYNFNINSAIILGKSLKLVGVDSPDFVMTKNCLLALYYLKNKGRNSISNILQDFHENWVGTGKYAATSLGSIISRSEILSLLVNAGLVHNENSKLQLSNKGQDFLNTLHPDCCDMDLPHRIKQWVELESSASPKIDIYIRTYFGKQKRYLNKIS